MKKKKYCECSVCGYEFFITSSSVYLAQNEPTIAEYLSGRTPAIFNATDCPNCSCQLILKDRVPKMVEAPELPEGE